MKARPILAVLPLVLAILACGQYVTPAPEKLVQSPAVTATAPAVAQKTGVPATQTEESTTYTPKTTKIISLSVNVRSAPDGAVIGALTSGDQVTVLVCQADWCQVENTQLQGWVWIGCLEGLSSKGCAAK